MLGPGCPMCPEGRVHFDAIAGFCDYASLAPEHPDLAFPHCHGCGWVGPDGWPNHELRPDGSARLF